MLSYSPIWSPGALCFPLALGCSGERPEHPDEQAFCSQHAAERRHVLRRIQLLSSSGLTSQGQ